MDVKLLSGALGAEISGISLNNINKEIFNTVNELLLEHKVIFFRDQNITPEEQIRFAKYFGPIEEHAYVKEEKAILR
jgi:taurine dioxygenase